MSARKNASEMPAAAERLARALRSGLDLRWSIPAPSLQAPNAFPPNGKVRPFLEPYADSIHFRLPRRPHPLHRLLRPLRYLLRMLIAPWLHLQSHFNLSTVSVIEQVEYRVRTLEATEAALHRDVQTLAKALLTRGDHDLNRQIDSLEEGFLLRVNRELGWQGKIGQAGLWFEPPVHVQLDREGPRIAGVSERILEQIFVHTHLPRPPARLLALGCGGSTNAIEMASLGFQVVGVDARPFPLHHPNFTMIRTHLAELPFEDESFDGAVALSTLGRLGSDGPAAEERVANEILRVLKHGGRFLATVPFGQGYGRPAQRLYDRARLDRLLHGFRVVERGYGVRDGETWSFTLDEQRAEQTDSGARLSAVCLLVLEKP